MKPGSRPKVTLFTIRLVWCAVVFACAARLQAQPAYYLTDLGTLPGGTNSQALALNNSEQVVGWSFTSNSAMHAFLYNGGAKIDLGTLLGGYSVAHAINDFGMIAGQSDRHAFVYSGGVFTDLDHLFYRSGSVAFGINNAGRTVGYWSYWTSVSFTCDPPGTLVGGAGLYTAAYAINNAGVIVGLLVTNAPAVDSSPTAWGDGAPFLNGTGSALAINDNGQILGSGDWTYHPVVSGTATPRPTGSSPFLYNSGVVTDLSALLAGALGLNNSGLIVGYITNGSGVQHAALYSGGTVTDLNTLIDTNAGFTLVAATAINNNDSIVGYGTSASGQQHAFLLTLFPGTPPTITTQPQDAVVQAHGTGSFGITASSLQPLSYQWRLNGTNIPGAIASTLTVSNVLQSNLGSYSVVVHNQAGSTISSNAVLSMYPFIATPFTGAVTYWGKPASFSIETLGSGPLHYQWLRNGAPIPGATNKVYALASVELTTAGLYSVIVNNAFGSVTNAPAQVVVLPAGISLALNPSVTINGVVGYTYTIQSTTNLLDTNSWVTATNLVLSQPVQIWVDTSVNASLPANPYRFYRVLPAQ